MEHLQSKTFDVWQKEVLNRFLKCLDYLINEEVVNSEEVFSHLIRERSDFISEIRKLDKYLSVRNLYQLYYRFNISPLFLLFGRGDPFLNKSGSLKNTTDLNRNFFLNQIRDNPHLYSDNPYRHISGLMQYSRIENSPIKETSLFESYVWRQLIWENHTSNSNSIREVPCIWQIDTLKHVVQYRGKNLDKIKFDSTSLIDGDPREVCIITKVDLINLPSSEGAQRVLLKLETDPAWFWPDPKFMYCATINNNLILGVFEAVREPDYIFFKPLGENDVQLLDRINISSIWRLERFW